MENKLRVFEAFSGVGSQSMALRNIGVDYDVVATSDIDKFAITSYATIHSNLKEELLNVRYNDLDLNRVRLELEDKGINRLPRNDDKLKELYIAVDISKNIGDISKLQMNDIPDHDLFTYSFPCQDISVAGNQEGLDEGSGTRSGLLWECKKVIEAKKPKYLMLENVKNLVGKRHKHNFDKWTEELSELGYNSYWKILNADDYGIPQNRERVFVISIRKDIDNGEFKFNASDIKETKLRDIFEIDVHESYYIEQSKIDNIITFKDNVAMIKQATKKGIIECEIGCIADLSHPNSKTRRGRVQNEGFVCPTLTATETGVHRIESPNRVRKLTPLECWRLMGFADNDYAKCKDIGISDSQLYKQAGNSIVVNVLENIFTELLNMQIGGVQHEKI